MDTSDKSHVTSLSGTFLSKKYQWIHQFINDNQMSFLDEEAWKIAEAKWIEFMEGKQ